MCLHNIDLSDRIPGNSVEIDRFNLQNSLYGNLAKQLAFRIEDFAAHARFGSIDENIYIGFIDFLSTVFLNKFDCLFSSYFVGWNNNSGVNLNPNKIIRPPQQFSGEYNDRSCAITHLFVLQLGKLNDDFCGGMVDIDLL